MKKNNHNRIFMMIGEIIGTSALGIQAAIYLLTSNNINTVDGMAKSLLLNPLCIIGIIFSAICIGASTKPIAEYRKYSGLVLATFIIDVVIFAGVTWIGLFFDNSATFATRASLLAVSAVFIMIDWVKAKNETEVLPNAVASPVGPMPQKYAKQQDDFAAKVEKLNNLRNSGAISQEEFEQLKSMYRKDTK